MKKLTTEYLKEHGISHTISADGLVYIDGDLSIPEYESVCFKNLAEVSGYVYVREGARFSAPALVKSGYVDVLEGARFSAPALAEVSGYVDVLEGARFSAPALAEVSGSVYVQEGARFSAPALAEVSGYVYVREGARFSAPALVKSGSVDVWEGARFSAPALVTVGHIAFETVFHGKQIRVFDGMGCVITSQKVRDGITIASARKASFKDKKLVGEKYFVVSKGEHHSHGETLEAAMSDLMFKTADRDVSKYRNMSNDTAKSPHEWAVVYRIITGACQFGTQAFIKEQGELKESYTLSELLEMTKGRFGHERFREVVA